MPDDEVVTPSSDSVPNDTPENSTPSLDTLVSTLTADQLASFLAAVPADTLRGIAVNQEHPLGKVVQSEADRRMESWRQTDLRNKEAERRRAEAAARQQWLETAPDEEVAAKLREETNLNRLTEQVRYQQFVTMFQELKPVIDGLSPDRRAKVAAFVQSPGADEQWYKLPTLVYGEYNSQQRETEEATRRAASEAESARKTAAAVSTAPPTDVGKGATKAAGPSTADLLRDQSSDLRDVAQALHDMGVRVPSKLLKKE